jgi:hypothetical protein
MEIRATLDEDAITKSAAQRLVDTLPYEVERGEVETTVRQRVRELCSTARVHTFVGILAERQARELLDRRADRGDAR